jgi:hypothetical protein
LSFFYRYDQIDSIRGYVTGDSNFGGSMSRNTLYELKQKSKGLKKVTLCLPEDSADDFKLMASLCCDNNDLTPSTVRSLTTGRMKGINSI